MAMRQSKLPSCSTVISEIFVRDLISYVSYLWLKVRNLVAYENHAHNTSLSDIALIVRKFTDSVQKFTNTRVRKFYAYENFCNYSSYHANHS